MYVHDTQVLIGKIPVPSHLGVKLPATPAPPAPVTDTGAPKNPNPDHASQPRTNVSAQIGMSTISGDELHLWQLPLQDTSLQNRRDVHTLLMNCKCGESAVSAPKTKHLALHNEGMSTTLSGNTYDKLQLWDTTVSSTLAPRICTTCKPGTATTKKRNATAEPTVFSTV